MARNKSETKPVNPSVNGIHHWHWTDSATRRALNVLGGDERISISAGQLRMLLEQENARGRHAALSAF